MKYISLLLLFLCSCSSTLAIHIDPDSDTQTNREFTRRGAGFLSLRVRFVPEDRATILLRFDEEQNGKCGEELREGLCTRKIWSCTGSTYVGHEIGHALGKKHTRKIETDRPPKGEGTLRYNIMDPSPLGNEATEDQKATAKIAAVALALCRRAKK